MRKLLSNRLVKFGLVGVVNTLVDLAIYTSLHVAGLLVFWANLISTSTALLVSLTLNRNFTWRDRQLTRPRLLLYIVVTLVGLWALQPVVISQLINLNHSVSYSSPLIAIFGHAKVINSLLPKLGATVVTLIWNYLWYHYVVFHHHKPANQVKPALSRRAATLGRGKRFRSLDKLVRLLSGWFN
jgi:putative flippase GtrA